MTVILRRPEIDTIKLDLALSEQHELSARTTDFPLENGALISDHIINDPETLQVQCVISNSPLHKDPSENYVADAYNALYKLHKSKQLVSVVTGLKVYSNMAITSISVPRSAATGNTLNFSISFKKVTIIGKDNIFETGLGVKTSLLEKIKTSERSLASDLQKEAQDTGQNVKVNKDKIAREQIAENEDVASVAEDPVGSLKDQVQSKLDFGRQILSDIHPIFAEIASDQLKLLYRRGQSIVTDQIVDAQRSVLESFTL